MFKKFFLFLLLASILMADSYNFTELRYSDATGQYTQLEGEITFFPDGLDIKYPLSKSELNYNKEILVYTKNAEEVTLDKLQKEQIIRYFDILRLLHMGDDSELRDLFEVSDFMGRSLLKPLGSLKYYLKHIELTKDENQLKYVKLFLENGDNISIKIHNEIR